MAEMPTWREEAHHAIRIAAANLIAWLDEDVRRIDELEKWEVDVIWRGDKRKSLQALEGRLAGIRPQATRGAPAHASHRTLAHLRNFR